MVDTGTIDVPPPAMARPDLDASLDRLSSRKDAWIGIGLSGRIQYLRRCIEGVLEVSDSWVAEACRRRRIDPGSTLAGEEWISGPMTTLRGLRLMVKALKHDGRPPPVSVRTEPGGQKIVKVFPRNVVDRFLYYNMTAEVWLEPGRPATQGRIYRDKAAGRVEPGRVALVLGAGNVSSIGPLDVVHKLFVEDQVALLKMNPVNEYLGPFFERAFRPLIDDGFLAVAYGGTDTGEYLCRHGRVDTIHLTGSDRTYDAIVWGGDKGERARRKREGRPLVDKPFTAELGSVTPVLVVPGPWTDADLDFQARHVAGMVAHNASFNCNAAKVLVVARGWDRREAFLARVEKALADTAPRYAYYPGARERYDAFLERYPRARVVGRDGKDVVPWTVIPDVPARPGEHALEREAFCGVLATVLLDAAGPAEFLERAVDLANDGIWGTLSCVVLVDPATESEHGDALEAAVARLRYGGVGINVWTGVNFGLGVTSWGAFPGHTRENIVSGVGAVHNALLLDHPQKSVVRAGFRIRPKPVWFADHANLRELGRLLTRFEAHPSPPALVHIAMAGLKG